MPITALIAKQLRDVYFGNNWTGVNLTDTLKDVDWQQATAKVHDFNTIAALVFHINYYIDAVMGVLQHTPLAAKDKYSFDHPPVESQQDWENLLNKSWAAVTDFTALVEAFPENQLEEVFVDEKYGSYYRNFTGIIEHTHYHLGQIVLIKKILSAKA